MSDADALPFGRPRPAGAAVPRGLDRADGRWPRPVSVAFVAGVSLALWGAIGGLVVALVN